ncbi:membrane protein insertase YidC [Streptomyces griseoviridis]|uniref:Membrane protein insertase YidC n=3 Tax=Streptomyces TaxID=1883 RepID=A0ABT9LE77_STRGD|nr:MULTISPECIES: membrane protein insertase YidC [Streptomyces]MDP9682021.1 YidC/Oxa1 family membrane protein insertase [Streptomyces griseoviridis]GGS16849.1 membrane protein [Streptomyces niveoruber]GGT03066.1 membrane protein [Streptomyces griseoviridis]GGU35279.1 membrane protein [Streptomyces daghestanicus]GHI33990.1 membrane protein [Streptomyces daghestanicus]
MSVFAGLVHDLADLLRPLFGAGAAAAAVVLFTALVRLLLHPLSRAAARGQKARAALRPRIDELRRRHARDPEKLRRAVLALHTEAKVSPLSGILPSLAQVPAFFLLYRLFTDGSDDGLMSHRLFAAPLGGTWGDALGSGGPLGGAGLVYAGLFAVVGVVAAAGYRLTRRAMADQPAALPDGAPGAVAALGRVTPFLSFFTLVTVAVVPLAAALYVVTSTAWGVAERAVLYR